MSFDTSKLTTYTKEHSKILITKAATSAKTAALLINLGNLRTGIKTSEKIGKLVTDAVFQSDTGCGFNPQGTTEISQREIVVGSIKVNEDLCPTTLEQFFTQQEMKPGPQEGLTKDVEQVYVEEKGKSINTDLEKAIWQGDKTLANGQLNKFDGFNTIIDAGASEVVWVNARKGAGTITATTGATGVTGVGTAFSSETAVGDKIYSEGSLIGTISAVGSNTSITLAANGAAAVTGKTFTIVKAAVSSPVTSFTSANIIDVMRSVYMAIPAEILDSEKPLYAFVGSEVARMHLDALVQANMFHVKVDDNNKLLDEGYFVPGTKLFVFPTSGLTNTGRINAIQPSNMWYGTDLENGQDEYKMWWSDDDQVVKYKAAWKSGVQLGILSEVTSFSLAK